MQEVISMQHELARSRQLARGISPRHGTRSGGRAQRRRASMSVQHKHSADAKGKEGNKRVRNPAHLSLGGEEVGGWLGWDGASVGRRTRWAFV